MNFSPSSFRPIIINSKKENIDIDTKKDWDYAKKLTKNYRNEHSKKKIYQFR